MSACKARTAGMKVTDWCAENGITKANFYYRLRKVREACLAAMPDEAVPASIVAIPKEIMHPTTQSSAAEGLDISVSGCTIHVAVHSSMELLSSVLQVITHAK